MQIKRIKNFERSLNTKRRQLVEKMNDKLNFIDERQKRRYEKVLQKTGEEYLQNRPANGFSTRI